MPEFDWDISKPRAEFIADIANSTRRQHFKARTALENREDVAEELNKYESALRSLFEEVRNQAKDEDNEYDDRIKEITNEITLYEKTKSRNKGPRELVEELENIDRKIQDLRVSLGLAIGKTEEKEERPEDLYQ